MPQSGIAEATEKAQRRLPDLPFLAAQLAVERQRIVPIKQNYPATHFSFFLLRRLTSDSRHNNIENVYSLIAQWHCRWDMLDITGLQVFATGMWRAMTPRSIDLMLIYRSDTPLAAMNIALSVLES